MKTMGELLEQTQWTDDELEHTLGRLDSALATLQEYGAVARPLCHFLRAHEQAFSCMAEHRKWERFCGRWYRSKELADKSREGFQQMMESR
jgi:hypothetical protein